MSLSRSFVALLLSGACALAHGADDAFERHYAAAVAPLDARARSTLDRIDGQGRRLLALRAYLRAGATLPQRWSWTAAEIDAWHDSPPQRALEADIDRVRRAFERSNAGYTLWVNPQVRSLDVQLERWNTNVSVRRAAERLESMVREELRSSGFIAAGTSSANARFADLLRNHVPQPIPTLAAPGLSAHGRMSAVDFQVRQGDRTVAGPDSAQVASVWIAKGWRDRLLAAVKAAGDRFAGPLASPVEPWHYDYRP